MRRGDATARAGGGGRGAGPEGTVRASAAPPPPQPLSPAPLSPPPAGRGAGARAHAGSRGLEAGRGLRSRVGGRAAAGALLRRARGPGERTGPRLKVKRGVSSCGGVLGPVSHRAVGGSPGRKPGGQRCGGQRRCGVPPWSRAVPRDRGSWADGTSQAASGGVGSFAALPGLPAIDPASFFKKKADHISERSGSGALLRNPQGSQRAKG